MRIPVVILLVFSLLVPMSGHAAGIAPKEDAKAMAMKAADYLAAAGPETAFRAFSSKDGPWHDRDLYVTVIDSAGMVVAHGANAGLIGHSVLELKDVDGRPFIKAFLAVQDPAWVDYKWRNPVTKAVEPKTQYTIRVGEYVVGVGAYAQ